MTDWIVALRAALTAEGHAVMITVAATRGSAPREAGARMIATARHIVGTIGGGHLEFEAIRIAREALSAGGAAWLARFPLAARLGQCCGGVATLLFQRFDASFDAPLDAIASRIESGGEVAIATRITPDGSGPVPVIPDSALPEAVRAAGQALLTRDDAPTLLVDDAGTSWFVERVKANDFRVVVFGNGHVGRALVQVLGALPCAVTWVDARESDFPATVPSNVAILVSDVPEAEARTAVPGSMFLAMTHSHALDFDVVASILARGDARYVGMIGSKAKRTQMERRLHERGFDAASIARVVCPIGIAGIDARDPGAIAVAVAAELLQERERGAVRSSWKRPRAGGER